MASEAVARRFGARGDRIALLARGKVGGNVERDLRRIALTRAEIGADIALMVDANGGYDTKQALSVARAAADHNLAWFEEPVSSDRLEDLALCAG